MSETNPANLTVLVVEDDDDSRYLMRLELERLGYLVSEAEDGVKAVDIALRDHPDIILMDLTLPEMDGLEATARIRADEKMREVPIIAVTAHSESIGEKKPSSGFDAYVTKPIDGGWLSESSRA